MAVTENKGIRSELIPRMATGFCAGTAYTGGMCGAVAGAIIALNLVYGRDDAGGSKEENYKAVQRFTAGFRSEFGELSCPGLTGVDLGTVKGHKEYTDKNLHERCAGFVEGATRIVLELSEKDRSKL